MKSISLWKQKRIMRTPTVEDNLSCKFSMFFPLTKDIQFGVPTRLKTYGCLNGVDNSILNKYSNESTKVQLNDI